MTEETLFTKIVNREIPADILFQDDRVTAFRDINPQAPCHVLVVPNKPISSVNEVEPEDEAVLGHLFVVAKIIAHQQGISKTGYRLIVNCGDDGGQEVYHIHMHVLGGKRIGRMVARD
jgi:histidine triad (HIT) family protein